MPASSPIVNIRVHYKAKDGTAICGADLSRNNRASEAIRDINCSFCKSKLGLTSRIPRWMKNGGRRGK